MLNLAAITQTLTPFICLIRLACVPSPGDLGGWQQAALHDPEV